MAQLLGGSGEQEAEGFWLAGRTLPKTEISQQNKAGATGGGQAKEITNKYISLSLSLGESHILTGLGTKIIKILDPERTLNHKNWDEILRALLLSPQTIHTTPLPRFPN